MADFEPYDPKKHGAVVAPPAGGGFEAYDPEKYGKVLENAPREFKDALTTASLPGGTLAGLKQYDSPIAALKDFPAAISDLGSKIGPMLAGTFGQLMTDDPRARQQIVAKHFPNAKAVDDKYGNPMIEFEGKKYYLAGEKGTIDQHDIARAGLATALSLPAAVVAPAGGLAAAGTFGLLGAGQSLGEDVLARAAGGTAQEVDPKKAAISGVINAALPLVGKAITPIASQVFRRVAAPLIDDAGQVTAKGASVFEKAGIDPSILTPAQLKILNDTHLGNFGSTGAVTAAHNEALATDFGVPHTRGQITNDPAQVALEDSLRNSGRGAEAVGIMKGADEARQVGLNDAQNKLRSGITGTAPKTPEEAGAVLSKAFVDERAAGAKAVSDIYTASSDPAIQAQHGIPNTVSMTNLDKSVESSLAKSGPGQMTLDKSFPSLAPWSAKALELVQETAAAAKPTGGGPVPSVTWDFVDRSRKELGKYYAKANASRDGTDINAMKRIMAGFDDHFDSSNPLLRDARAAHGEQMATFAGGKGSSKATNATLKTLGLIDNQGNAVEPGVGVVNKIFGTMNRGEAQPVIEHLVNNVYKNNPEAIATLKDQALRRIFTAADDSSTALSPAKAATAMEKALGDRQGGAYRALFSQDELNTVQRYLAMNRNLADVLDPANPPRSGHIMGAIMKKYASTGTLGTVGSFVGHHLAGPIGGEIGLLAGGAAGRAIDASLARGAARSAINPPANLLPPLVTHTPNRVLGLGRGLLDEELDRRLQQGR